jgi:hypothetical protein
LWERRAERARPLGASAANAETRIGAFEEMRRVSGPVEATNDDVWEQRRRLAAGNFQLSCADERPQARSRATTHVQTTHVQTTHAQTTHARQLTHRRLTHRQPRTRTPHADEHARDPTRTRPRAHSTDRSVPRDASRRPHGIGSVNHKVHNTHRTLAGASHDARQPPRSCHTRGATRAANST